jgi:hypothetical protein
LEASEALACALPVLAVDRSVEELARYREILKEALSSPAIKEIMTTPLQSHIMAVVVRDGGKPPERRWQLFSNFYDVIKKREANRNLPDRGVARLLREGDKLVKTLHNRLGFELHARAERSEGAQTSIEKPELRNIVVEIVSILQESEIAETVETLMRATTERLVLVSTPESGASVRFDIRPLQEFFAAEYLYETASDVGFQERLQIIAGDSHWREVLHFLLSALIEQGRRNELAQAVHVLIALDDPADDQRRPLSRSLFRGGGFAARLLREGVLEADKRVRHQFHPCMAALLAATDAGVALPVVGSPHSRDWLGGVISSALEENVPAENIGACVISPSIMNTEDARGASVAEYALCQAAAYRRVFISKGVGRVFHPDQTRGLPLWFVRYAVREMMRKDWYELGQSSLNSLYIVLAADLELTVSTMVHECLPLDASEVIASSFETEHGSGTVLRSEKLFGVITKNFLAGPEKLTEQWDSGIVERMLSLPGVFGTISAVIIASKNRRESDFDRVSRLIEDDFSRLVLLPSLIAEMFLSIEWIKTQSGGDFLEQIIREDMPGKRRMMLIDSVSDDDADWPGLSERFPQVIPYAFGGHFPSIGRREIAEWLQSEGAIDHLIETLREGREILKNTDLPSVLNECPRLVKC